MTNPTQEHHPMPENASQPASAESRREKQASPWPGQVAPREVHSALADDDEIRGYVLGRFRAFGGDMDRWQGRDRAIMADAIAHGEDAVEYRRTSARREALRAPLRAVRRRLEREAA